MKFLIIFYESCGELYSKEEDNLEQNEYGNFVCSECGAILEKT